VTGTLFDSETPPGGGVGTPPASNEGGPLPLTWGVGCLGVPPMHGPNRATAGARPGLSCRNTSPLLASMFMLAIPVGGDEEDVGLVAHEGDEGGRPLQTPR
jgi:hypothetical protein